MSREISLKFSNKNLTSKCFYMFKNIRSPFLLNNNLLKNYNNKKQISLDFENSNSYFHNFKKNRFSYNEYSKFTSHIRNSSDINTMIGSSKKYFCSSLKKDSNGNKDSKKINLLFVYANGNKEVHAEAEVGKSILEIAHKYDVDLEGACDSSLACSTCHIILDQQLYDKLPAAKEEEEDLLDLAFGLSHTSRLGCQVIITDEFEGTKITIPSATRNLYVDGHKPKPH